MSKGSPGNDVCVKYVHPFFKLSEIKPFLVEADLPQARTESVAALGGKALYKPAFHGLMGFEQLQIDGVCHSLVTRVVRVQMIAAVIRRQ